MVPLSTGPATGVEDIREAQSRVADLIQLGRGYLYSEKKVHPWKPPVLILDHIGSIYLCVCIFKCIFILVIEYWIYWRDGTNETTG